LSALVQALQLLVGYHDGRLTDGELVTRLSELPRRTLQLFPNGDLKTKILEVKAAVERGETFIISGGITKAEVEERAAKGSPAAQAILKSRRNQ